MREAGFALLFASFILALFIFIPQTFEKPASAPIVATVEPIPNAYADVSVEAKAAIVYDLTTGETLYAKNAKAQLPLASLTKLLTVYAALSILSPSTPITIPAEVAEMEAPHAFNVFFTCPFSRIYSYK